MSRLSELIESLPPATLAIVGVLISTYILQILLDPQLKEYTLNPDLILHQGQIYRMFTSTLFHGSLIHIGINLMSTLALGRALEQHQLGTLGLGATSILSMVLTPAVYIILAAAAASVGYQGWMQQHALGFSGILFHWAVLEASTHQGHRSVLGLIQVPSHLYPWALLVVLQIFMPNLSLVGHLSGILVGTLQYYRVIRIPRSLLIHWEEQYTWLSHTNKYCPVPSLEDAPRTSILQVSRQACTTLIMYIGWILETLRFIILGISRTPPSRGAILVEAGDDDDDWNGLPELDDERVDERLV
jgi:rhomboid domain-containing protein 1